MSYKVTILPQEEQSEPNQIHVNFTEGQVRATLRAFLFNDHGFTMCYVPSLNLSAYGANTDEAKSMMFDSVVPDFCQTILELSKAKAFEYLSGLGWFVRGVDSEEFENTVFVDKDGVLRNFDLPADTIIEEELLSV